MVERVALRFLGCRWRNVPAGVLGREGLHIHNGFTTSAGYLAGDGTRQAHHPVNRFFCLCTIYE